MRVGHYVRFGVSLDLRMAPRGGLVVLRHNKATSSRFVAQLLLQAPVRRAAVAKPGEMSDAAVTLVGFEVLPLRFEPASPDHIGRLGEFTWDPPVECSFQADDHTGTDWLALLRAVAGLP